MDLNRLGMIGNILSNMGTASDFQQGFGQSFNLDNEDRRDVLYAHREAEGKAAIPPRHVQILSQHPLVDTVRQHVTTTDNPVVQEIGRRLKPIGLGPFNDGMYAFRTNTGMNVGGPVSEEARIPAWNLDEGTSEKASKKIAKDKERVRGLPKLTKLGYALGGMANDFTNNATRNLWWLINAPQATVDVLSEGITAGINPDLYSEDTIDLNEAIKKNLVQYSPVVSEDRLNKEINRLRHQSSQIDFSDVLGDLSGEESYGKKGEERIEAELNKKARDILYSKEDAKNYKRAAPGVRIRSALDENNNRRYEVRRRRFSPTLVNLASMLPASIAINTGIGLMGGEDNGAITGRQAGYKAAVPSEEDPRVASNPIAEVAMRYIMGREGQLMDMDDFLLERPDVTAGEYANYKGYLRDRETDINPFDDGKVNLAGILKANADGIRGPEISFLGKSMGLNDTLIPTASAIAGSALGALAGYKNPRLRNNKTAQMLSLSGGGALGLLGGSVTGTALEDQRRRNNFEERNPGVNYETFRQNARQLMDKKYELIKANPNASVEKEESKVGFNKRAQQQALQTRALQQQTMIDQIIDEDRKSQAAQAMLKQQAMLERSNAIDEEIRRRRQGQEEEQPMTISF